MLVDVVKPKVAYRVEGLNIKGKPVHAVVDIDASDKLVPVLDLQCKETPKATLWERIKKHP